MSAQLTEARLLAGISRQWRMDFVCLRPEIALTGSPERSIWRSVVETDGGQLFVLEKVPSRRYDRKRRIIRTLEALHEGELTRIPRYHPDTRGEFIPLIHHGLWQLCPFVPGVDLDRPAYVADKWRGDATADFLIRFHRVCSRNRMHINTQPFSIAAYSRELYTTLCRNAPAIAARYCRFMDHLEMVFFPVLDQLPLQFCHGDFHPLNIIWGNQSIRAVIDWEFSGTNVEAYDLANLLGCLGMEDPQSLTGPFVERLVARVKKSEIYCGESWKALPDLMLAIRFAWLSEWMRKSDRPMIRMEYDFMSLLMRQRQDLQSAFLKA